MFNTHIHWYSSAITTKEYMSFILIYKSNQCFIHSFHSSVSWNFISRQKSENIQYHCHVGKATRNCLRYNFILFFYTILVKCIKSIFMFSDKKPCVRYSCSSLRHEPQSALKGFVFPLELSITSEQPFSPFNLDYNNFYFIVTCFTFKK